MRASPNRRKKPRRKKPRRFPSRLRAARRIPRPLLLEKLERRDLMTVSYSLSASPDVSIESQIAEGVFTFTRTGDTLPSTRTLYYHITGTAVHNGDYYSLGGQVDQNNNLVSSVTFTGNTTSINVPIWAFFDDDVEGNETVTLQLAEPCCSGCGCCGGSTYTVPFGPEVTVTIKDVPVVSIRASDPVAVEPAASGDEADPGQFRVTRDGGDLSMGVTVYYTVTYNPSTDAVMGSDYASLYSGTYGSVSIGGGQTSATIDIEPLFDSPGESPENVQLTLVADPYPGCTQGHYAVGSPNSATLTIHEKVTTYTPKCQCECECTCGVHSGANPVTGIPTVKPSPGAGTMPGLKYDASPLADSVAGLSTILAPTKGAATLSEVEVTLQVDQQTVPAVYYDGAGAQGNTLYDFAVPFDAAPLTPGVHPWTMTVEQTYSDTTTQTVTYHGEQRVDRATYSELGRGWSLPGLERLWEGDDSVIITGTCSAPVFRSDGQGGWLGDLGQGPWGLTGDAASGYELFDPMNTKRDFSPLGLLTAVTDPRGNETTYSYTDADGDSVTDELYQIIDPVGRAVTFAYGMDGRLDTITDFTGAVTTYNHNSNGDLISITQPDPDGAGPLAAAVTSFTYDSATGLMTSYTDPENDTTSFTYGLAGRVATIEHPGSETETFFPLATRAVIDTSVEGTQMDPAGLIESDNVEGEQRDALNHATTLEADRFGQPARVTDPLGNTTTYQRDSHGRPTSITLPDPDGAGSLTAPEIEYEYDSRGNVLEVTHPDSSTESWTYHANWNAPTSYTDPLGNVTVYVLDSTTGLLEEERRIVGQDDRSSSETDDVVTEFTYTPLPSMIGDPPAGLIETITDPLGRVTEFLYDAFGQVTNIIYAKFTADEAEVEFEYDTDGNLTAEIDELGRRTEYEYDDLGRLIEITQPDPDGAGALAAPVTTFLYNKINRLTKQTDSLGRETLYEYDEHGNVTEVTQPDHDGDANLTVTTMTYTARGELETLTDPLGRVTEFLYDALGRNTEITLPDPDGAGSLLSPVLEYAYDALGRRTQSLDPLANATDMEYANFGRIVTTTLADPDGGGSQTRPESTSEYDAAGNVIETTDALGNVTTYEYDVLNRLIEVTLPDPDGAGSQTSPVLEYEYDKAGNLRYMTDALGNLTEYQYDNRDRLVKIIQADPDGAGSLTSPEITYAYDMAGQRISDTDPLGNTTVYEYDGLGRVIEVTAPDPDGAGSQTASVTSFTYDAVGNLLTVTDPLSHVTEYEYDAHDNRTKIIDAELGETTFTYDAAGNLLSLTDPVGNTTTWVYDDLGRTIEETNELNKTRTFEYDAANNLTKRTDRNGRVIEFVYDDLHRRTSELWKNGSTTVRTLSWQYDALGRVTNSSDPAAEFDYTYDNLGRRTSVLHDLAGLLFDVELMSEYDAAGNRTDLKALVNGTADFWNEYLYDNLHRTTSIEQHGAAGGSAVAEKRIDFTYDAASQWNTITRYEDLIGSALVATSTYTYDNAGRLTALTHAQNTNVLADYDWAYDVVDRITSFSNGLYSAESATYSYDDTNQLIGADRSGTSNDESFAYDANGNRTMTGHTTGDNNQLTSDGVYNYEYDDEGNRTKRILLVSGSPTGATTEYAWDHRNRLTKITERTSPTGSNTAIYDYVYDLWGRRIAKLLDTDADSDYDEETHYLLDGERHERGHAGDHIVLTFNRTGNLTNRYLHGPAVDQILADEIIDDIHGTTVPGEVLWPLTDNLGTVRDLANYDSVMDVTSIANHITYDSYGSITAETGSTITHAYAFTSRERDYESKLYHYRARYYDSGAGRFVNEDRIGFAGGDANLTRVVGGRPNSSRDPSGMAETDDRPEGPGNLDLVNVDHKLEQLINNAILEALKAWRLGQGHKLRPPEEAIPEYVYVLLATEVKGSGFSHWFAQYFLEEKARRTRIESALMKSLDATKNEINFIKFSDCRYRKTPIHLASPFPAYMVASGADHTIAPTIQVNSVIIGIDKWGHFFQQGYWLYMASIKYNLSEKQLDEFSRWLEGDKNVYLDNESRLLYLKIAMEFSNGEVNRFGFYGAWSTGIVSEADIEANWMGYQFYKALASDPQNYRFRISRYSNVSLRELNETWNRSYIDPRVKCE